MEQENHIERRPMGSREKTAWVILAAALVCTLVLSVLYVGKTSEVADYSERADINSPSVAPSRNYTSTDYALMGDAAVKAFSCTALAGVSGNESEAERLFEYGYSQGKLFITAVRGELIADADYNAHVPVAWSLVGGGPSDDFILGKLYSAMQEDALDGVYVSVSGRLHSDEEQVRTASIRFSDDNCSLIGR